MTNLRTLSRDVFLALVGVALALWLAACAAAPRPWGEPPTTMRAAGLTVPAIAPRPDDVQSLDGLMKAFYVVTNVAPDEPRQFARDRTLYVPDIKFVSLEGKDGSERSRGVNALEPYFDGQRWWVTSVTWQIEDAKHPIPAELLP